MNTDGRSKQKQEDNQKASSLARNSRMSILVATILRSLQRRTEKKKAQQPPMRGFVLQNVRPGAKIRSSWKRNRLERPSSQLELSSDTTEISRR